MARQIADRLDTTLTTGTHGIVYFPPLTGNEASATVSAVQNTVTFWIEYGRETDDPTDYPFKSSVVTVAAGESAGLFLKVAAASVGARLVINNSSGVSVAVIADAGVR